MQATEPLARFSSLARVSAVLRDNSNEHHTRWYIRSQKSPTLLKSILSTYHYHWNYEGKLSIEQFYHLTEKQLFPNTLRKLYHGLTLAWINLDTWFVYMSVKRTHLCLFFSGKWCNSVVLVVSVSLNNSIKRPRCKLKSMHTHFKVQTVI